MNDIDRINFTHVFWSGFALGLIVALAGLGLLTVYSMIVTAQAVKRIKAQAEQEDDDDPSEAWKKGPQE